MTPYKRVSNAIDTLRREINAAHPGRSKMALAPQPATLVVP